MEPEAKEEAKESVTVPADGTSGGEGASTAEPASPPRPMVDLDEEEMAAEADERVDVKSEADAETEAPTDAPARNAGSSNNPDKWTTEEDEALADISFRFLADLHAGAEIPGVATTLWCKFRDWINADRATRGVPNRNGIGMLCRLRRSRTPKLIEARDALTCEAAGAAKPEKPSAGSGSAAVRVGSGKWSHAEDCRLALVARAYRAQVGAFTAESFLGWLAGPAGLKAKSDAGLEHRTDASMYNRLSYQGGGTTSSELHAEYDAIFKARPWRADEDAAVVAILSKFGRERAVRDFSWKMFFDWVKTSKPKDPHVARLAERTAAAMEQRLRKAPKGSPMEAVLAKMDGGPDSPPAAAQAPADDRKRRASAPAAPPPAKKGRPAAAGSSSPASPSRASAGPAPAAGGGRNSVAAKAIRAALEARRLALEVPPPKAKAGPGRPKAAPAPPPPKPAAKAGPGRPKAGPGRPKAGPGRPKAAVRGRGRPPGKAAAKRGRPAGASSASAGERRGRQPTPSPPPSEGRSETPSSHEASAAEEEEEEKGSEGKRTRRAGGRATPAQTPKEEPRDEEATPDSAPSPRPREAASPPPASQPAPTPAPTARPSLPAAPVAVAIHSPPAPPAPQEHENSGVVALLRAAAAAPSAPSSASVSPLARPPPTMRIQLRRLGRYGDPGVGFSVSRGEPIAEARRRASDLFGFEVVDFSDRNLDSVSETAQFFEGRGLAFFVASADDLGL